MINLPGHPDPSGNRHLFPGAGPASPDPMGGTAAPLRRELPPDGSSRIGAPLVEILTNRDATSAAGRPDPDATDDRRGPLRAALFSLAVPGLGQLRQRRRVLGFGFLLAAVALWLARIGWIVHLAAAAEAWLAARRKPPEGTRIPASSPSGSAE